MRSNIEWTLAKILAYLVFVVNAIMAFVFIYLAQMGGPDQAETNLELIDRAVSVIGSGTMWTAILMGAKAGAQAIQRNNEAQRSAG